MSYTPITAAAVLAATAATLTYAALSAESQLFGPTLIAPQDPTQLALTYDDGPNPSATPQLLELLARHNIRATFFVIGNFVRQCPALTREVAAAGHLIGNHTMTHPWLAWQSSARIRAELADTNALLEDTLGTAIHYFRAPHGARRPAVLRIAAELNLIPVQWNLIVSDWNTPEPATLHTRITCGIARNQRKGHATNLVLHDGGHTALDQPRLPTVAATRLLLDGPEGSNRNFVTIDAWDSSKSNAKITNPL